MLTVTWAPLAPTDIIVFLPAGPTDCTGGYTASLGVSGGFLSPTMQITLTPSASWGPAGGSGEGYYRMCYTQVKPPTGDSDFIYVPGVLLLVSTAPPPGSKLPLCK